MSILSIRKLSENWRRLQQWFGMIIDMHWFGMLSEDAELMMMGSRTSRMVPDGLPKIPKPSRIKPSASKFLKFKIWMPKLFWSRFGPKCREGFQKCSGRTQKGFRTSRRHAETSRFCEFRFREPFGGLVDGMSKRHVVDVK